MKLIEADKVKQVMKDCLKAQVNKTLKLVNGNEANDRINSCLEYNHDLLKAIDELPSAEPDTTTHDSIPAETGKNYGDRTSGDCISRQQAIDAFYLYPNINWTTLDVLMKIHELPSAQPERKDAIEKAVAVEAISDELMSRFDISATYAYDVAESAVNRIEVMAKEMGKR